MKTVRACEQRDSLEVATDVGPLSDSESLFEREEKCNRGAEELEVSRILLVPGGLIRPGYADRAVKHLADFVASRSVGFLHRVFINPIAAAFSSSELALPCSEVCPE